MDLVNGKRFGTLDLRQGEWPWLMPILANIENKIQNTPSSLPPAGGGGFRALTGVPPIREAIREILRLLRLC